jgi:hypothetical protein
MFQQGVRIYPVSGIGTIIGHKAHHCLVWPHQARYRHYCHCCLRPTSWLLQFGHEDGPGPLLWIPYRLHCLQVLLQLSWLVYGCHCPGSASPPAGPLPVRSLLAGPPPVPLACLQAPLPWAAPPLLADPPPAPLARIRAILSWWHLHRQQVLFQLPWLICRRHCPGQHLHHQQVLLWLRSSTGDTVLGGASTIGRSSSSSPGLFMDATTLGSTSTIGRSSLGSSSSTPSQY